MARKTKRDWLVAGAQILLADGPQGLTIESLCQFLNMTKGSFYHHFGSYERFKQAFLTFYEQEGTIDIISKLAHLPTPQAKLHKLLEIVVAFSTQQPPHAEVAVRAWALQDTAVRQTQSRVDGRRRAYVQSLCEEIIENVSLAKTSANLLYAVLVGSEQMQPPIVGNELQHLFDECLKTFGLD